MDTQPTKEELMDKIQLLKKAYDDYNQKISEINQELDDLEKSVNESTK